ncbi:MAG: SprT-like domain-containing protein [Verrucomicrobiae bacterium]|nr:SprT-like domain-containing protein [Verrucomicrobiae bacterium]
MAMPRSSQMMFDFLIDRKRRRFPQPAPDPVSAPNVEPQVKQEPKPAPARSRTGQDGALTALAQRLSTELAMHDLAAAVRVTWNPRLKTTAGTACPRTSNIDLNPRLGEFDDAVTQRILRHELAHLVAHRRAGRRRIAAHGMEWRQACCDLGIPGEKSRHTLPFKTNPRRRNYAYQCPACGDVVLRVRKLARYSACWACCKAHNRGKYAERFQLAPIPLEKGILLAKLRENGGAQGTQ